MHFTPFPATNFQMFKSFCLKWNPAFPLFSLFIFSFFKLKSSSKTYSKMTKYLQSAILALAFSHHVKSEIAIFDHSDISVWTFIDSVATLEPKLCENLIELRFKGASGYTLRSVGEETFVCDFLNVTQMPEGNQAGPILYYSYDAPYCVVPATCENSSCCSFDQCVPSQKGPWFCSNERDSFLNIEIVGHDIQQAVKAQNLYACGNICKGTPNCVAVSYSDGDNLCYLKSQFAFIQIRNGVRSVHFGADKNIWLP
uniref:AlNc14C96G5867 protein n=1 Tax=Albugo laibachii Nc14 TaxID=890382 RepID=F0WGZ2_9STRA|nr:AlNc14C96G5867 [Albugo laibachii Nc14]|eukprot:CCA20507.1 AlNc14C96G5867 [Albugo laibachii Nc14]